MTFTELKTGSFNSFFWVYLRKLCVDPVGVFLIAAVQQNENNHGDEKEENKAQTSSIKKRRAYREDKSCFPDRFVFIVPPLRQCFPESSDYSTVACDRFHPNTRHYYLHQTRLCDSRHCLFVSEITEKVTDGLKWNFWETLIMDQGSRGYELLKSAASLTSYHDLPGNAFLSPSLVLGAICARCTWMNAF